MAENTLKNYDLELCRHLKYTHLINSIYNRSLGIMINKFSITLLTLFLIQDVVGLSLVVSFQPTGVVGALPTWEREAQP
mgnify:CR=1 FL=1